MAHNIHLLSQRNNRPLVEVKCAAIPEELIKSDFLAYPDFAHLDD